MTSAKRYYERGNAHSIKGDFAKAEELKNAECEISKEKRSVETGWARGI